MVRKQQAIDYAAYLFVRLVICVVQALPLGLLKSLSDHLGWACWHVLKLRRRTVKENLQIAFPELSPAARDDIALGMWKHLFLMICEIAHAPRKLHRTNWRDHSTISHMQEIIRQLIADRPMVIISGHVGNFELGGYLLALHGFENHTIARPLDNPYLDRFINQFRGATGQYMLAKQGSGPEITELLQNHGTLVLLGDQFAGNAGCWVDFFGKPASTHKAVAVFSLGSTAPTGVCAAIRQGRPLQFCLEVVDITDPAAADFAWGTIPLLTRWYTKNLENLIREHPGQYWWVHRRWKGDPSDRRRMRQERHEQRVA